jgi:hypothetical protein
MATPANRTPVRIARGTFDNLNASILDLEEGEICYATEENAIYLVEGGVLTPLDVSSTASNAEYIREIIGTNQTLEPKGHANREDSTVSFNETTRVFTIEPSDETFDVWCNGIKYTKTEAETVTIPDVTGIYYIYYDSTAVLSYRPDYFEWENDTPTAYIYWNATTQKAPYFADERHGIVLDWATHEYLHRTRGAVLANGFSLSNYTISGSGSTDADAQVDLAGGTFFDEDLEVIVVHSNTPTAGTWEQDLQGPAQIPVLYLDGTSWVRDNPTDFPLKAGTSTPQYNLLTSGSWSTVDAGTNTFVVQYLIATNNLTYPVMAVMGQSTYSNIGQAEAATFSQLVLTGFPSVEFRPLYKLIYQTGSYGNTISARLRGVLDIRTFTATSGGTAVSDHGVLTGLADDDHVQYLHVSTSRTGVTANIGTSGTLSTSNTTASSSSSTGALTVAGGAGVGGDVNVGGTLGVTGATTLGSTLSVPLGSASAPTVTFSGDTNTGIYSPGADQVAISTNGTGRLFVDASGFVGVNQSTPLDDVHIASANPAIVFDETDATTDNKYWRFRANSGILNLEGVSDDFITSSSALRFTRATASSQTDNIQFYTGASERLRLDSSGHLGLGTSSPATLLHISSATGAAPPTPTELRIATTSASAGWSTTNPWGRISFYNADGSGGGPKIHAAIDATAFGPGGGASDINFLTNITTADTLSNRLTIKGDTGNVGIGTTSPEEILHVAKNVTSGGTDTLGFFSGGISAIAGSGALVHLNGGSGLNRSAYIGGINETGNSNGHAFVIGTSAASAAPTERARIDSSGRLLVGTSSADNNIYISNSANTPQVQIKGSTNSTASASIINTTSANAGRLHLAAGSLGDNPTANSSVGLIYFSGFDGTNYRNCSFISSAIDGTPGANDMPGRIVLSTTPSGSAAPVERLRISSNGAIGLGTTAPAATAHVGGNTIVSNVDVANASYDGVSFSVAAEESAPSDLFFSPDGRKMFVMGTNGDEVNEYTLSTPWLVSSATYVTVFSVAAQENDPRGFFFRADGLKLYIAGNQNDTVYQYALTTPWSIATASYESISFSVGTQETIPTGLTFKPDGLSMYVVGNATDTVFQYTLSTAWNVSTASLLQSFSVTAQETVPQELSFTADGSRMFVLGSSGDDVTIYNLTTPWDISTAAHVTQFSVAAQELAPTGLFVKPDGTKFYIVGSTNDTVYQYTIPSAQIDLTGTTKLNGDVEVAQNVDVAGEYRQGGYGGTLCRAWVNFNGTGTVAIRAQYNVSSITDNGTGDYTVNFATAMVDANYAVSVESYAVGSNYTVKRSTVTKTTTTFNFGTAGWGGAAASNTAAADSEFVSVAIFR